MKKINITFIIFFSFFLFGISKAQATDEIIVPYDLAFEKFKEENYLLRYAGAKVGNIEKGLKDLISALKENNVKYVITTYMNGSYPDFYFQDLYIYEFSDDLIEYDVTKKGVSYGYELEFVPKQKTYAFVSLETSSVYSSKDLEAPFQFLIDYVNENKHLPKSSSKYWYYSDYSKINSDFLSSNTLFYKGVIYDTNVSMKLASLTNFDGIKVLDKVYTKNSILPTYMNTVGYGREVYTENYQFSTKGIDRIEYTFDTPSDMMYLTDFNYSVTWDYENASLDNLSYPYFTWEVDNGSALSQLKNGSFTGEGEVGYADTISWVFTSPPRQLKFIVDVSKMSSLDNSTVLIHFDSEYPFIREFIEASETPVNPPITSPDTDQDILDSLDKTNDYIMDDTPPSADISGLGNIQGLLPPGPLDSLLNIPVQFLTVVTNSLGGQCTPLTGTWVYDQSITFPCFDTIFWNDFEDNTLLNFLELIPCALILITYFKHLYKKVERATSMSSNSDDEWGVI